jgi:site-specific DNA-methyltransferase (adenine-specific)
MPVVSKTTEWETPHDLFDSLWEEFDGFDLDPCCQFSDYTAQRILQNGGSVYTPSDDGLSQAWGGKVYMNPPYGRGVEAWVSKAFGEVMQGHAPLVVALLKATTDTKWWHTYVERFTTPRFIRGRLRFANATSHAPFPSVIIVWRG